jgi:HlyD family secretion protein
VVQIRKSPERVNNVVTYTVVISAQNPDLALLPGMTATVRIVVGEASSALLVPNAALRFHPPGQELEEADRQPSAHSGDGTAAAPREPGRAGRVWVLGEDDGPEPVDLRIGVADQRVSEMISGPLEEGRSVIVGIDHEAGR